MNKAKPYIGVTGFMELDEVERCRECWAELCQNETPQRLLMIGILISSTTLAGQVNSLSGQFPRCSLIRKIVIDSPYLFNCLHFNTRAPENLYDQLMLSMDYGGEKINGIQLNMVWPEAKALQRVKTQYPRLKYVLQVSPHLAGYQLMTPMQVACKIKAVYGNLIDYVLVDFSRGLGQELPLDDVRLYLRAIAEINPDISLGTGSGLYAENLRPLITQLTPEFPDLSFDAQGRLHDNSDGGGRLMLPETIAYLKEGAQITVPTK